MISFDDFKKTELKVADVLEVSEVEGKDKLFLIKINLGSEERQIVAGLRQFYSKEELEGKKIIVVSNLEPANIGGIKSEAMLLAVKNESGEYKVLEAPEGSPAGAMLE